MVSKILCYGEMLWDVFPGKAVPGGAPMNVAIGLKKLGADVSFLSSCGHDKRGEELLKYLEDSDISTKYIQRNDYPTGIVKVELSEDNKATFEILFPAAWDYIRKPDNIPAFEVIVFGSLACRHTSSFDTLKILLENKTLKICDVNFRPPYLDQAIVELLLGKADIVKMNREELSLVSGLNGTRQETLEEEAELVFNKYNIRILCVTLGAQGAFLMTGHDRIYQKGFRVNTVDTVGAGDAFLAGFIHYYLNNKPLKETLEFACRLGAYVASREGANPPFHKDSLDKLRT
ncbi:MAG: carbohydrate kinase [Bacteroidales bacterium]|nr:carbohydrate kinase [Bacteroidales bacterium]